jgi:hypothetical protein
MMRTLPLIALLGIVFLALTMLAPLDYRFFAEAARAWRNGTSQLYDAGASQFFYAPWALVLLVPLSYLPDRLGQALFNLISLISLGWGVWILAQPRSLSALVLALATPFTAAILVLGQWDALIVGSVALAWYAIGRYQPWLLGMALVVITTKPTNALLVIVVLLYAIRGWPVRDLARALALPALVLAGSGLACGWDWPIRYLDYLRATPPLGYDVSLWRPEVPVVWALLLSLGAGGWLLWCVWRHGVTGDVLALTFVVNLLISPFVVPYHFVGTAPALAVARRRDWRIGAVLWVSATIAFFAFILRWSVLPLSLYLIGLFISLIALSWAPVTEPSPAHDGRR